MNLVPIKQNMIELNLRRYSKDIKILFSYQTPVAYCDGFQFYKTDRRWSNITTRHINQWLKGLPAKVIPQYELDDLLKEVQ